MIDHVSRPEASVGCLVNTAISGLPPSGRAFFLASVRMRGASRCPRSVPTFAPPCGTPWANSLLTRQRCPGVLCKSQPRPARFSCSTVQDDGVRLNKCFKSQYSRRESDILINDGRVTVNGVCAKVGTRVRQGDEVALDGNVVEWERLTLGEKDVFTYLKFHKPLGIVTTADTAIPNNIISCLDSNGYSGKDRVFTVGRLDEETSGVILCTTDGALVQAALGKNSRSAKEYIVGTDQRVSDDDCATLREGVVIKTVTQYSHGRKPLLAPTLPCVVERAVPDDQDDNQLRVVLREGRNRQIRKMLGAVGSYTVRSLRRISFMGITLEGIEAPGSWALLNEAEMALVRQCLSEKATAP